MDNIKAKLKEEEFVDTLISTAKAVATNSPVDVKKIYTANRATIDVISNMLKDAKPPAAAAAQDAKEPAEAAAAAQDAKEPAEAAAAAQDAKEPAEAAAAAQDAKEPAEAAAANGAVGALQNGLRAAGIGVGAARVLRATQKNEPTAAASPPLNPLADAKDAGATEKPNDYDLQGVTGGRKRTKKTNYYRKRRGTRRRRRGSRRRRSRRN